MDEFYDGPNYKNTKNLLSVFGLWPYQSPKLSRTLVTVIAAVGFTQFLTKICGMFPNLHDINIVIECLTPIIIDISSIMKITNSVVYMKEIREMLDRIREDFHTLRNSSDIEILRKYADNGRRFVNVYMGVMFMVMFTFMLMPLQPMLLGNATRPKLHRVEYYVDMDKYFVPILIHGYLTVAICISSIVAADSIFILFVQHVCGLFSVAGFRIEKAIEEEYVPGSPEPPVLKDKSYKNIVQCARDHKSAIRFADLMEAAYTKHFLFHAGLNMVAISITGVGALDKLDEPSELLRLAAVSWALLFHLAFESLNAQQLMDYSANLHVNLINCKWYDATARTKKIVAIMLMKTQTPCVLTAGGMFVLCMNTFAVILKTAMSYFTFLRSAQ